LKLHFSRAALHDLIRLREFIAEHNPDAAGRISKRLRGSIKGILDAPQIGRLVEDIDAEVREMVFGRYVVRYEILGNNLYILRIWHGKENRKVCAWH